MIWVELVGGRLCGARRAVTARVPDYVWVELNKRHELRFYRSSAGRRALYRLDHAKRVDSAWVNYYLWCENTVAYCSSCEVMHQREGAFCSICEGPLTVPH